MPTKVEKREKKLSLFSDDLFANFTDLFGGKLVKWSTLILLNILVIKTKQTNVKKRLFWLTFVLVVDSSNSVQGGDGCSAKTLGKSRFHCQNNWSGNGPAGQF